MVWPLLARYLVAIAAGSSWAIASPVVIVAWMFVLALLLLHDLSGIVRRMRRRSP